MKHFEVFKNKNNSGMFISQKNIKVGIEIEKKGRKSEMVTFHMK